MGNQTVRQVQVFSSFITAMEGLRFPMVVVYYSPEDYRGMYVARLFDLDTATGYFALANSIVEIRTTIPTGMTRIQRDAEDAASIVEIWV
jgi:hypothetical protein